MKSLADGVGARQPLASPFLFFLLYARACFFLFFLLLFLFFSVLKGGRVLLFFSQN